MEKKRNLLVALTIAALVAWLVYLPSSQVREPSAGHISESWVAAGVSSEETSPSDADASVAPSTSIASASSESIIAIDAASPEPPIQTIDPDCNTDVTVRVTNGPNGSPVPSVGVQLGSLTAPFQRYTEYSDMKGVAAMGLVPCGKYMIHSFIRHGGQLVEPIEVTISEESPRIELVVDRYQELQVRVLEADGRPMANLKIRTRQTWDESGITEQLYTTDGAGEFVAKNSIPRFPLKLSMAEDAVFLYWDGETPPVVDDSIPGANPNTSGNDETAIWLPADSDAPAIVYAKRIEPLTVCFGVENVPEYLKNATMKISILGRSVELKDGAGCIVLPKTAGREFQYRLRIIKMFAPDMPGEIGGQDGTVAFAEDETEKTVMLELFGGRRIQLHATLETGEPARDAVFGISFGQNGEATHQGGITTDQTDTNGMLSFSIPATAEIMSVEISISESYILPTKLDFQVNQIGVDPVEIKLEKAPMIYGEVLFPNGDVPERAQVWAIDADGNRALNMEACAADQYGRFVMYGTSALKTGAFVLLASTEDWTYGSMLLQPACPDRREVNFRLSERVTKWFPGDRREDLKVSLVSDTLRIDVPGEKKMSCAVIISYDPWSDRTSVGYMASEHIRIDGPPAAEE